jgi:hypothetical protein
MTTKAEREQEAKHASEFLKSVLQEGMPVYTNVTHVAKSGMMRCVRLYIGTTGSYLVGKEYERKEFPAILDITYYVARVLDRTMDDRGIKMHGCGYDAGYDLVDALARKLFDRAAHNQDGYILRQERI